MYDAASILLMAFGDETMVSSAPPLKDRSHACLELPGLSALGGSGLTGALSCHTCSFHCLLFIATGSAFPSIVGCLSLFWAWAHSLFPSALVAAVSFYLF